MATVAPYGTWKSPIAAEVISGGSITFNEVHFNNADGKVYVVETRPTEKGRYCIVGWDGLEWKDVLPSQFNARSQVHEYGGAACAMSPDGCIIFTDWQTKGVFRLISGVVEPIISASPDVYFGDFNVHPLTPHLILAIQEDHRTSPVQNTLVLINSETKEVTVVAAGCDFYLHPRFSHDGRRVCWMQWNFPDMPWNGSELCVADWIDCRFSNSTTVAGCPGSESVCQPKWDSDGNLFFASDRTGFLQLYYLDNDGRVLPLVLDSYENADLAAKEGALGNSTFIVLNSGQLVVTFIRNATHGLLLVDKVTKKCTRLASDIIEIQKSSVRRISDTTFVVVGTTFTKPAALYLVDINNPEDKTLLKRSVEIDLPVDLISQAQHISFPRTHGENLSGLAHAIWTAPKNPKYSSPLGAKPPLIVFVHGGPAFHITPALSIVAQYWTSRGFAYVYLNYGGSTGYGRAYCEMLNGHCGVLDVADAASCVNFLASSNLIDASRVGIIGRSAGGFNVLRSLITYPGVWTAGVCMFGTGNIETKIQKTHKYESQYNLVLLCGKGFSKQQREQVVREMSPCYNTDKIKAPLLFLHGREDKVIPVEQSQEMAAIMAARGADVKVVVFDGEAHGFRMEKSILCAIKEEHMLWERILLV